MHAVTVLKDGFDTNPYLHGSLIGVNLLLLISLIIRFEWPWIVKKCGKKDVKNNNNNNNNNHHNHNHNHHQNEINRTNGMFPSRSNLEINRASVQTLSQTQSPKEANDQYQYLTVNADETRITNGDHNTTNPATNTATTMSVPMSAPANDFQFFNSMMQSMTAGKSVGNASFTGNMGMGNSMSNFVITPNYKGTAPPSASMSLTGGVPNHHAHFGNGPSVSIHNFMGSNPSTGITSKCIYSDFCDV